MLYNIEIDELELIWTSLNEAPKKANTIGSEKLFKRIVENGWAFNSDLEDLFYYTEPRLDKRELSIDTFCDTFGIRKEIIYYKPNLQANSISGFRAIRVEDLVFILIILERIGFNTDATGLVEKLLLSLKAKSKKLLSESELEIFWFKKTRFKTPSIILSTTNWFDTSYTVKELKTEKGFKINAKIDQEKRPIYLEILAPKFRQQREPITTICADCNYTWQKGDPTSSAAHRREHKRRMNYLDPQPSPLLLKSERSNTNYELVTTSSPKWKHKEMYERALAFKREFSYDFTQWESPKGDQDSSAHGFLFTNENSAIIGACTFRRKNLVWSLEWVWICPKERRKKHLAKRWKMLREKFGDFIVEPPVSNEMKAFLYKYKDEALLESITERGVV